MAETHLGYPAVAQSQGDIAASQGTWGQVLCELLATTHLPALNVCHPMAFQAQISCL